MHRRHRMPFGAELDPAGGVRFALWAPAVSDVVLRLDGEDVAMERADDGWFTTSVAHARAGARYRFRLPSGLEVPDPASRLQPDGVHGASEVVDPDAYDWRDDGWRGRALHEVVFYELHVGTFTREGTYAAAMERLDGLAALGITAVELMPLAAGPGGRGWGYDGAYPFAPEARYGRPEALKRFVDAAHARGLMVVVDVVYNHFGPEGNYLAAYAPFFTERHHTPWGAAIDFEGPRPVRDFFIQNALYWVVEYHVDGLRLDAVHAIHDASEPHVLVELGETVHRTVRDRPVHLILENDANAACLLARDGGRPRWYAAQWNDDLHHALHVVATGEHEGYYADYADDPVARLGRALAEGFVYQGEPSAYRDGVARGDPSAHLPPTAFVAFLQNHDQVGNRAFGERLAALVPAEVLHAVTAVLLLVPQLPLLFMGEEWGATQPFPFFCDFGPELAPRVRDGRRQEFARFAAFADPHARERIPDPGAPDTFAQAVLRWEDADAPAGRAWRARHETLLALRRQEIVPRLAAVRGDAAFATVGARGVRVTWRLGDGAVLTLLANFGTAPITVAPPPGRLLYTTGADPAGGALPPWSVVWALAEARA